MNSIPVRCYYEKQKLVYTYFDGHFHTNLFQNSIKSIVCHELAVADDIVGTS